jgi:hypothetical protein
MMIDQVLLDVHSYFFASFTLALVLSNPPPTAQAATALDEVGQPQKPAKALAYSLAVITLQRPDPRPLTATAWFAVMVETILGPIQVALLILAVRRRFMR